MRRILGLDVGERRLGVALSDPLGLTAQRLAVIERKGTEADLEVIRSLVAQHGVGTIVIGLPLALRGERGSAAKRIAAFARYLESRLAVPVRLVDERFTTVQGERVLRETATPRRKRKQLIDQVAAQLILQQYLETQRAAP